MYQINYKRHETSFTILMSGNGTPSWCGITVDEVSTLFVT